MTWLLALIPAPWRWVALLALAAALVGYGYVQGVQHGADKAEQLAAAALSDQHGAVLARLADNAKLAAKQRAANLTITKAKNEELATLRADLFFAERMRVPAFCPAVAGTAAPASAASSNAADSATGLLPRGVEADIRRLILETEEAAATGRACQAFLAANGLVP